MNEPRELHARQVARRAVNAGEVPARLGGLRIVVRQKAATVILVERALSTAYPASQPTCRRQRSPSRRATVQRRDTMSELSVRRACQPILEPPEQRQRARLRMGGQGSGRSAAAKPWLALAHRESPKLRFDPPRCTERCITTSQNSAIHRCSGSGPQHCPRVDGGRACVGTIARGCDTHREAPLVTLERPQVQQLHLQQVARLRRVHGDGPAQIMHLRGERSHTTTRCSLLARTVHPALRAALVGIRREGAAPHLCEVHMLDVIGAVVVLDLSARPVHRLHTEHLSIASPRSRG